MATAIYKGIPRQWRQFCPTVEGKRARLPAGVKRTAVHDAKNAFHSMMLTLGSRRFCVSKFRDGTGRIRYIMAVGGDQGCAPCALFFPVWVEFGYNFFFGKGHEDWWTDFQDDILWFSICRMMEVMVS